MSSSRIRHQCHCWAWAEDGETLALQAPGPSHGPVRRRGHGPGARRRCRHSHSQLGQQAPEQGRLAPDLLVAECANILWKKTRRNELTPEEAHLAARLLQRAELAPMRKLLKSATKLAIALDHPAYDCTYLALAEDLSCDLVTADRTLSRKTLPPGYKTKVIGLTSAMP